MKYRAAAGREEDTLPENDAACAGFLAGAVSLLAFAYFSRLGAILLYGDATAHIQIARRVFDSRNPGLSQLGTVWLPLPHLLMLPFVLSYSAWHSGLAGSVPSMFAYAAGTAGIFRLVRGALPHGWLGRFAAWFAALIYAANPNLLYLQATAMTEPLYLAWFIWAAVFFGEFVQAAGSSDAAAGERRRRALRRCGWMLAAAMLTRYDGWFAAAVFALAAFAVFWRWTGGRIALWRSPLRPAFTRFLLVLALSPALWLVYNAIYWGNPIEFATGPYSARAIEARAERPGGWHYPGWHSPRVAAAYVVKAAKLNMAGGISRPEAPESNAAPPSRWRLQNGWLPLALLGTVLLLLWARALWPILLLWLPLLFYTLNVAWGGVPIFVPAWWPFSYYNLRYGLQLLPAFAVLTVLAGYFPARALTAPSGSPASPPPARPVPKPALPPWRWTAVAVLAAGFCWFVAGSYVVVWRSTPICLREAQINSRGRFLFDQQLAGQLQRLPPGATVLMYTAYHAAALEFAGFPLRRTINETNNKLWRNALAAPAQYADYVIAFENPGDPVWRAVQQHADELKLLAILNAPQQARALIYRRR